MSTFNDIDIECEKCGEEYRGTVWVAVHAGQDPKLKDLLLGGELNLVSCPECGYVSFQEHFMIYQDPNAELVVYVYPEAQRPQGEELQKLMMQGFQEAQKMIPEKQRIPYEPLLLFGLEDLIELLTKEAGFAEQSQIAQVLCKENKMSVEFLSPSQARRLETMRILPRTGNGHPATRKEILEGIEQLMQIDPALDLYAKLRASIQTNPEWRF